MKNNLINMYIIIFNGKEIIELYLLKYNYSLHIKIKSDDYFYKIFVF